MSESTINLLLQIPLAGVVVFVVLVFLRHQEKSSTEMLGFMAEQSKINREFLSAQREQNNTALARLAEEQKETRIQMAMLTDTIDRLIGRIPKKLERNGS